jgi:hypothetical protein
MNYNYLKKILLNNNVLNDISHNKLKYIAYNQKGLKSQYSNIINNENFNIKNINKVSLQTLNNLNNNICVNDQNVWYETFNKNEQNLFNIFKKMHLNKFKESLNWKSHLYNLYDLN